MNKVRVRIAVAIDPHGQWSSAGWSGADDATMMGNCVDTLAVGEKRYWLEAELEIPQIEVVQPAVKEA